MRVDKTATCWNWTGCLDRKGYGVIGDQKLTMRVHRLAYSLLVGPLTPEVQIDHRCHNPRCVNPKHLRPVTSKQNAENRAGAQKNNLSSGVRGVTFQKRNRKWMAQVTHGGRNVYCGLYQTIAEAETAVIAKRLELFTHNDLDRTAEPA
jgi:hypothetical protein